MADMQFFAEIVSKYSDRADFVNVYIEEAHSTDGWKMDRNKYSIMKHTSMDSRLKAAKFFQESIAIDCPLLVDVISDDTNLAYGGLPERLAIIMDGTVRFITGIGPYGYSMDDMEAALVFLLSKQ